MSNKNSAVRFPISAPVSPGLPSLGPTSTDPFFLDKILDLVTRDASRLQRVSQRFRIEEVCQSLPWIRLCRGIQGVTARL